MTAATATAPEQPPLSILDCMDDPNLWAPWFRHGDWTAWRAFLAALFGLPLDDDQRATYESCTSRTAAPQATFGEAWLACGRRAGKSFITALTAVYIAAFRDYRANLQPGERAEVLILAADKRQARTILRYARALLTEVPILAQLVERETAEGLDLTNRVSIEIVTASFRATRGYTIVAALLEEIAFWRSEESTNPDHEIVNAIRPGMATIPGSMLIGLSSPYSKRGVLYNAWRRHYGDDESDVLVWQAATRTMNPSVPQSIVDRAYEDDPDAAAAEYGALFRADLEQYISREQVEACQRPDPVEVPPAKGTRYVAFVDPSGGARDSMTLAIAHRTRDGGAVVDTVAERRAPFSPEDVTHEFADILKRYRVHSVVGDRYGGEWPREAFRRYGIAYEVAGQARSDLYRDTLPLFTSGRLELPPGTRVAHQFASLERHTSKAGKDRIDHPPHGHDDVANAIAGVAVACAGQAQSQVIARPIKGFM